MFGWEMNFRINLEDLHRVPSNVQAPLILLLLLTAEVNQTVASDHPQKQPAIMTTPWFEENHCCYNHNVLIWDISLFSIVAGWLVACLHQTWSVSCDRLGSTLSEVHSWTSKKIICHIRKGRLHFKQYVNISCLDISYLMLGSVYFLCVLAFVARLCKQTGWVNTFSLPIFFFFFQRETHRQA